VTPAEIARDHRNAVKHLKRLCQYTDIAGKRWRRHEEECTPCRLEIEDESEVVCGTGLYLFTRWQALQEAVWIMKGTMALK